MRVGPSAYVDRPRYEAASPERQHEMATRAVVRTFDGRVYASHYPALTLMSLPVFGAPRAHLHVAPAADSWHALCRAPGRPYGGDPSASLGERAPSCGGPHYTPASRRVGTPTTGVARNAERSVAR